MVDVLFDEIRVKRSCRLADGRVAGFVGGSPDE